MEAELHFEREQIDGIAVVGTYLIDAARRNGVTVGGECGRLGLCDSCAVVVTAGAEYLTAPTRAETETLADSRREAGERLACQAKIAAVGKIEIRTIEPKDPRTETERLVDSFRRHFEALPLEDKISQLLEFEAVALNETVAFVMNSPYKAGGKIVDFLSRFGFEKDRPNGASADAKTVDADAQPVDADTAADATNAEATDAETPDESR